MSEVYGLESDIYFGDLKSATVDWRKENIADEEDPDDEELEVTPSYVVFILGFDPKDL